MKTRMAVTFSAGPCPRSSRSRTCRPPRSTWTNTDLAPLASRSILKTRPAIGPSEGASRTGSSRGSASISSGTPEPVTAEPLRIGTSGLSRSRTSKVTKSTSAPTRSVLLRNTTVVMPSRWSARISTRVWACTPSTAETTSTAPSSNVSDRSTSAMKSEWPGVSNRLVLTPLMSKETTAARMVMPRRRSIAIVSVWVLPASTLPGASSTPASKSRRSVRVVLPASTWARIPKFSVRNLHVLLAGGLEGGERCSHRWCSWRSADIGHPMATRVREQRQRVIAPHPAYRGRGGRAVTCFP